MESRTMKMKLYANHPPKRVHELLLVSMHQIVFIIRTLCLYAFRLYIWNMHITSMSMKIPMMIVGVVRAVRAAIGNDHYPLKIIVLKMCQLHQVRIESMCTINGPSMLNKRPHIVRVLAIIAQPHFKNIMQVHS